MQEQAKSKVLIDLQYLPCTSFFSTLLQFDEIVLENNEHYVKQSYRNRCYILGANKVEMLVVPILDGNRKILIKDIQIDYQQRWPEIHWRTIKAAYGKSPFFEFFGDYFQQVLQKKPHFLWDLNFEILTICLRLLRINKTISLSENYEKDPETGVFDARGAISPKKETETGIYSYQESYQQNFGNEFVPNLSIIDLLFCRGNQSLGILKKSSIK
ncbi:WbqC family protein [Emticicia sp. BO119]|uniref:WbqC family protein n=1 Tax=Emticicia sp. BO119 TaxID=2757768 RepID=UPI0015F060DE|nr:WbqC family protein [Emticicia sp. BO119]MBA4849917.1 WbqC family protein [Emticicia sp. BO119]